VQLPERVLFVGAHCDDIELLAGGLLTALCRARTHSVGVLLFSDHRGVVDDAAAARAYGEFLENLAWLRSLGGPVEDHTGDLMSACRGEFQARRGEIYAAMERLRTDYDLVVTHPLSDTNQDHQQVAAEAIRVFKAHASVLGGEFPNNDVGGFQPSVWVPLSDEAMAGKRRLVYAYGSQRFDGRPYFDEDLVSGLARVRGAQIRSPWAEAFAVQTRVIATLRG
jgi:LmbE family N-acetylglucosaminyl deacetylase